MKNFELHNVMMSCIYHDFASPLAALMMSLDAYQDCHDKVFLENIEISTKKLHTMLELHRLMNLKENTQNTRWESTLRNFLAQTNINLYMEATESSIPHIHGKMIASSTMILKRLAPKGGDISIHYTNDRIEASVSTRLMLIQEFSIDHEVPNTKNIFDFYLKYLAESQNMKIEINSQNASHSIVVFA